MLAYSIKDLVSRMTGKAKCVIGRNGKNSDCLAGEQCLHSKPSLKGSVYEHCVWSRCIDDTYIIALWVIHQIHVHVHASYIVQVCLL